MEQQTVTVCDPGQSARVRPGQTKLGLPDSLWFRVSLSSVLPCSKQSGAARQGLTWRQLSASLAANWRRPTEQSRSQLSPCRAIGVTSWPTSPRSASSACCASVSQPVVQVVYPSWALINAKSCHMHSVTCNFR